MPKNVVVVGMPRSGTSMVAGIFGRRGYFLAEDPASELRAGDHHNPFGYWEAETLTRLNAAVFAAAGFSEDTTWLGQPIPDAAVRRIGELEPLEGHRALVTAYEARAPWVWKDPRLCYTLAYWWPMLAGTDTRVLLTRRDPEAVYRSFLRVRWREATNESHADVLARIEGHLGAARASIERLGIPCLELGYEGFADDPDGTAARLNEFLDLDLRSDDLGFVRKLDHSSLRGRLATFLDHCYERLPTPLRRLSKRLAPRGLVRALFPERDLR